MGSQRTFSIKELVKIISDLSSREVKIKIDSSRFRPFDIDNLVCNYEKANRLLGWKPEISITDGLKSTIEWVKNNGISFNAPFKGWTS